MGISSNVGCIAGQPMSFVEFARAVAVCGFSLMLLDCHYFVQLVVNTYTNCCFNDCASKYKTEQFMIWGCHAASMRCSLLGHQSCEDGISTEYF
jgi:hypothetical protein